MRVRRIELRVPGVRRQADVAANGLQRCVVELDRSIDAEIGATVRGAWRSAGAGIESNPRADRLGSSGRRTRQPAIIEGNADRVGDSVISHLQIRLKLVHWTDISV